MFVCCFLRQPQPLPPPLRVNARNGHDKARLRPVAGHKRALWTPATLAPFSLILSHLRPGGGNLTAAYTPAARRRAGSLRSVYVGEGWHKCDEGITLRDLGYSAISIMSKYISRVCSSSSFFVRCRNPFFS